MAPKWTAERDQHLLLLIINNTKIDFNDIAKRWAEKFVNEDFKPSPKAILEHVAKLKRDMKGFSGPAGGGQSASTPKSTPRATPVSKRTTNIKTPQSRKRAATAMSDDDEDDDDEKFDLSTPLPKRQTTSRRSKSRTASYVDPGSSGEEGAKDANDEESDDGLDDAFASVKAGIQDKADGHDPQKRDSVVNSDGGKGKAAAVRDYMAEDSDISDFNPQA